MDANVEIEDPEPPAARIMLVDDMPENLEMLSRRLEPLGFEVVAHTDGAVALQAAIISPPDLFILDVNMPGLDGFALCELLKGVESLREVPVVFLSAAGDMKAKLEAFERGGVDYISKPFHFPEVLARVRVHLDLRQTQRRYLEAKLAAEHASRSKDRFIATISHELRTPLNAVLGMAEVLLDESFGPLNDKQRSYVRFIREGGDHLLRQVNDLLEVAFIDAGGVRLVREDIDPVASARWVGACLGARLAQKRITLSLPADAPPVPVHADETRLRQILLNLVNNAIENTPEDGAIALRVLRDATLDRVRIEVEDTGPGVPDEDRGRIFREFERSRLEERPPGGGKGLGLAIARRLVRLQGGDIGVEPNPDGGSVFWFTLPPAADGTADAGP